MSTSATPEAPRHVLELGVRAPRRASRDPRLERHAADRAGAGLRLEHLRVHRADPLDALAGCRRPARPPRWPAGSQGLVIACGARRPSFASQCSGSAAKRSRQRGCRSSRSCPRAVRAAARRRRVHLHPAHGVGLGRDTPQADPLGSVLVGHGVPLHPRSEQGIRTQADLSERRPSGAAAPLSAARSPCARAAARTGRGCSSSGIGQTFSSERTSHCPLMRESRKPSSGVNCCCASARPVSRIVGTLSSGTLLAVLAWLSRLGDREQPLLGVLVDAVDRQHPLVALESPRRSGPRRDASRRRRGALRSCRRDPTRARARRASIAARHREHALVAQPRDERRRLVLGAARLEADRGEASCRQTARSTMSRRERVRDRGGIGLDAEGDVARREALPQPPPHLAPAPALVEHGLERRSRGPRDAAGPARRRRARSDRPPRGRGRAELRLGVGAQRVQQLRLAGAGRPRSGSRRAGACSFSCLSSARKRASSVISASRTSAWPMVSRGSFELDHWSAPSRKRERLAGRAAHRAVSRPALLRPASQASRSKMSKVCRSPAKLIRCD